MTHQKRLPAPRHYPIPRKEMKYVSTVEGSRSRDQAIPAVVFLREVMGYAENSEEATRIIEDGQLLRNGATLTDIRQGIGVLDTVEFPETDEVYRIIRNGEDLDFIPVEESNVVAKITGKRTEGEEYVYELHNGENHRTDKQFGKGNTIVKDGSTREIKLEEGSEVLVIDGKHAGEVAELGKVSQGGLEPDTGRVEADQEFETRLENLVAVEGIQVKR